MGDASSRMRARAAGCVAAVLLLVLSASIARPEVAGAANRLTLTGVVTAADTPLPGRGLTLFATDPAGGTPSVLGAATTAADGTFSLVYDAPTTAGSILYLTAASLGSADERLLVLASVLGPAAPASVVVNERTTVATAYGMARFAFGTAIRGPLPGLPNAASMTRNLVDPETGAIGTVLDSAPNGEETETRRTFNALANMVSACVPSPAACADLVASATTEKGLPAPNTFSAVVNIARSPWQNVDALFALATRPPQNNQPTRALPPDAWTLALRFAGDGQSMDGPGNFAVDHEGHLWVANNYQYSPDPFAPVCGSNQLLEIAPDGSYAAGSPYTGGGLSGAGFGVTVDPYGSVWVGNYGFAAPGCTELPPHNSASQFTLDGRAVSPDQGWVVGGISWPQGTVSDQQGTIWLANCGNDSVTRIANGDPTAAQQLTNLGLTKPFDLAFAPSGRGFVTGIDSNNVAMLNPDGTPVPGSPISGAFDRPMGVATDSTGHAWVDNSGLIDIPCPGVIAPEGHGGSLTLLGPDGTIINTFTGGGLTIPWGNAVDGNGNVFVANFAGRRLSQFCGVPAKGCRPGTTTGAAISPDQGYGFDGFVRNTGTVVDPSGNVWVTNNWKDIPVQTNPGGYQVVAFIGLGEPVPVPAPQTRPVPTTSTTSTPPPSTPPTAAPAMPLAVDPRFTG